MNLANEIIWMRLRLASWLVGKHTLVKNVDIGTNGAGLYLAGDTKKYIGNINFECVKYGMLLLGGECCVFGFFKGVVGGNSAFEDHDHE